MRAGRVVLSPIPHTIASRAAGLHDLRTAFPVVSFRALI